MIVVEIRLVSARGFEHNEDLGTLVIDNVTTRERLAETGGKRCDYRCRMYRKGALPKYAAAGGAGTMVALAKPTREGEVRDHQRLAEPVGNLVAKALAVLGYRHA